MKIFLFIQKICTSFHYDTFITLFFQTNNIIVVGKEHFYQRKETFWSKESQTFLKAILLKRIGSNISKSGKSTKPELLHFKLSQLI